eukprot:10703432-Karenia_brevis.AAC.1
MAYHRIAHKRSDLHALLVQSWAASQSGRRKVAGPMSKIWQITKKLRWSWPAPFVFQDAGG